MKRKILMGLGALSMIAAVGTANAADLPRRAPAPVYKAPVFSAYNWTGFYAGINAGGGWGRSSFDGTPSTGSFNTSGGLVGGTLGYNWQANQAVFGLETDLDWTNIRGSATCGALSCETRNSYLGTVRGRLGYAADRFMPYVTGGLAYGNIKANTTGFAGGSQAKAGWTLGAGVEVAVAGPWTAKFEYLYADLGKYDCGTSCSTTAPQNVKLNANIVRAGLNYRF
jgi:outer membrane immunogenic protein